MSLDTSETIAIIALVAALIMPAAIFLHGRRQISNTLPDIARVDIHEVEIAELRGQINTMRVEMEILRHQKSLSDAELSSAKDSIDWQKKHIAELVTEKEILEMRINGLRQYIRELQET